MSTERDADRLAGADADRDPEMIDVGRDTIDFRGERNWSAGKMNQVAMVKSKVAARGLLSASMWQAFRERS